MAGRQRLPCECQCHGRCIVEVARDVMGDVDRSSVYMDTRMRNDRKHECERKSLCHTITIYNSRHEKAQWPCLVARANYSAMPLRFMALIFNFVLETLECALSSSCFVVDDALTVVRVVT